MTREELSKLWKVMVRVRVRVRVRVSHYELSNIDAQGEREVGKQLTAQFDLRAALLAGNDTVPISVWHDRDYAFYRVPL